MTFVLQNNKSCSKMAAGKYIWIVLLYIILFTSPHMHWSVTLCQFKAKFLN